MPDKKVKWYVAGLNFECLGCGNCCAGPDEGFIWTSSEEAERIAKFLEMPPGRFRRKYLKRLFNRSSIIEDAATKDCVFLTKHGKGRGCKIYPVRPNQCRTWPFWTSNLHSPDTWNEAAVRCPGINRGKHYSFVEIEKLRKQKKWRHEDDE